MKALSLISTGVLLLPFGAVAPSYAHQGRMLSLRNRSDRPGLKSSNGRPIAHPASSMAASGSLSLTRGRNTGRTIGTRTPAADTIYATQGIPALESQ